MLSWGPGTPGYTPRPAAPPWLAEVAGADLGKVPAVTSFMFDSDQPQALADPRFAGCRVATYADLMTAQLAAQFAGRLVVIDRGYGDPMGLATVADCEPALLSVAATVDKVHQWTREGRQYITVYHDRALWAELDAALGTIRPWNWVATLDGTMNPEGRYPAAVQIADESKIGMHVDVSVVWQEAWHPMPAAPEAAQLAALKQLAAQVAPGLAQVVHILESF